jgi:hypothetical protein
MLLPRALHLLCAKTLLLLDPKVPQRLSRRLGVRILHAHGSYDRLFLVQYATLSTVRCIVTQSLRDGVVCRG